MSECSGGQPGDRHGPGGIRLPAATIAALVARDDVAELEALTEPAAITAWLDVRELRWDRRLPLTGPAEV